MLKFLLHTLFLGFFFFFSAGGVKTCPHFVHLQCKYIFCASCKSTIALISFSKVILKEGVAVKTKESRSQLSNIKVERLHFMFF